MSSWVSGKTRSIAVASTCEHEWRSSWRGVIMEGKEAGERRTEKGEWRREKEVRSQKVGLFCPGHGDHSVVTESTEKSGLHCNNSGATRGGCVRRWRGYWGGRWIFRSRSPCRAGKPICCRIPTTR